MSLNPHTAASLRPLKIMIVDDSAVVRGLISRWLEQEPDMVLAGLAIDGAKGVEKVREIQPDVLILDIEMPNMGGLEALPKLLAAKPGLKVLMASTLTTRGANVTLRALELGAADYIPKPDSSRIGGADGFRSELLTKIRALCGRTRSWPLPPGAGTVERAPQVEKPAALERPSPAPAGFTPAPRPIITPAAPVLRARSGGPKRIDALVVGASTGGPPALRAFLLGLGPDWKLPVLIVQHMPATFTAILAEHLDKALPQRVVEAKDGMNIESRTIYIAPGDFHMTIKGPLGLPTLKLDQGPQVNWCRPAVDPLFRSAAEVYGNHALGVVLTGMGHDGRDGAQALVNVNGSVLVQDEASSVVWGMPGAVAEAGLAELIKPIPGLSAACKTFARGERPQ
ncbi:chemotaxis response regulator protein-glutamate methylesterase [Asticcacaulis sp. EMRT-3]|uniref:protein-glutamate methylesterase/protein-glutamine glutaminase n=1 Tax=Asticcacaulis sp. EMRT-3 TaxID=3040349 RepID=UPI0024AFEAD6|nr:chemotaxis response regulator protein-glutamate methylesterase [Asticcacaulis sp. EMRT-3]MDI7775419.1 chemotaxis response regulator protein-glutamate methylesterase [Asticcacaulis sp. EMRT-3]